MSLLASVRDLLQDQERDDGREDSGRCCLAIMECQRTDRHE